MAMKMKRKGEIPTTEWLGISQGMEESEAWGE